MELKELRKKQREVRARKVDLEEMKKDIVSLETETNKLYQRAGELRDYIFELRKQDEATV